jgi:hypothetical protein
MFWFFPGEIFGCFGTIKPAVRPDFDFISPKFFNLRYSGFGWPEIRLFPSGKNQKNGIYQLNILYT